MCVVIALHDLTASVYTVDDTSWVTSSDCPNNVPTSQLCDIIKRQVHSFIVIMWLTFWRHIIECTCDVTSVTSPPTCRGHNRKRRTVTEGCRVIESGLQSSSLKLILDTQLFTFNHSARRHQDRKLALDELFTPDRALQPPAVSSGNDVINL